MCTYLEIISWCQMTVLKLCKLPDMVGDFFKYSNKSNKNLQYDLFVGYFWFFLACFE